MRTPLLLFPLNIGAAPSHFGHRFITFESDIPTSGPGGNVGGVEDSQ
jgi:hypothetical protein